MFFLKWLAIIVTTPIWIPVFLASIGILITVVSVFIVIVWFFILCGVIAFLQMLFRLHLYLKRLYKRIWKI